MHRYCTPGHLAPSDRPPYGESMRTLLIVLGLATGALWGGCDTATFYCGDIDHPSSCYCKADYQPCDGLGDCMNGCELP
jgi:hypothetical protein